MSNETSPNTAATQLEMPQSAAIPQPESATPSTPEPVAVPIEVILASREYEAGIGYWSAHGHEVMEKVAEHWFKFLEACFIVGLLGASAELSTGSNRYVLFFLHYLSMMILMYTGASEARKAERR